MTIRATAWSQSSTPSPAADQVGSICIAPADRSVTSVAKCSIWSAAGTPGSSSVPMRSTIGSSA